MEGVKQSAHRSLIIMRLQGLKIKIMQSLARQKKETSQGDNQSDNILFENDFKKACRTSFTAWKSSARERAQEQEQEEEKKRAASASVSLEGRASNVDIFDQPVRRAPRVTHDVSAVSSSSVPVPVPVPVAVASPQAAFDIFDQPVRRAPRATQDVSAVSSSSSVPVPVPVPVPALAPVLASAPVVPNLDVE